MRERRALLVGTTIAVLAFGAPPAPADHHFISIREVDPGTTGDATAEFVELQMYANGQDNLNPASSIQLFGADGLLNEEFAPLLDASFGNSQRTFLFGNTFDRFTIVPDYGYDVDAIEPAGGAVCFDSNTFGLVDCVAWGTVTNPPPSAGTPFAGAIPSGSSLRRSIARGCSTLLEAGDDTDSSAADFALSSNPTPYPNAEPPSEQECPNTTITKQPKKKTTKRRAKFEFKATPASNDFTCKLDDGPFKDCDSPFSKRVKVGKHKFKVQAEGDDSPASYGWKVKKKN